jgi:tetratricopeptide (TPR) repeat protein
MATKKSRRYRKDKHSLAKVGASDSWQHTHDCCDEINRALALQKSGKILQAADIYRAILEKDPRHPDALHLLGMLMAQQGNYLEAIELIRAAITNFPQSEILYNNFGECVIPRRPA